MTTNNRNVQLQYHVIMLTVMEGAEDLMKRRKFMTARLPYAKKWIFYFCFVISGVLCVCMYVCMYVCVCVCVCVYVCMYVCMCKYIYLRFISSFSDDVYTNYTQNFISYITAETVR